MKRPGNSEKQGLLIRSIHPQVVGDSVYSFPHIFISQKLMGTLKFKWGEQIILSAGNNKDSKTCKASVFVEDKVQEKEVKVSQGVCKELHLHQNDRLIIQLGTSKSPEIKMRRNTSPQLPHFLPEELKQLSNELYVFGKNNEIELIATIEHGKLKVQAKSFQDMRIYSAEVKDEIEGIPIHQIFQYLRDPKKYEYSSEKKSIIINTQKKIEIKLKKSLNSFRLLDNEILFKLIDNLNEKVKVMEVNSKSSELKLIGGSSNNSYETMESLKQKNQKMFVKSQSGKTGKTQRKRKELELFQTGYDLQIYSEIAKLKKKLKSIDFKIDHINSEQITKIIPKQNKTSPQIGKRIDVIIRNIEKLAFQIDKVSNATLNSSIVLNQQNKQLKQRINVVEDKLNVGETSSQNIQSIVKSQIKNQVNGIISLLECYRQDNLNTKIDKSIPKIAKKESLSVDFGSKFIEQFLVQGKKVVRMGEKLDWTQLLTSSVVPRNGLTRYQISIMESKFNYIIFGVINQKCKNEVSSWASQNCYSYSGWNGKVYIEGQCQKEARGFMSGEIVGLEIDLNEGVIRWTVDDEIIFESQRQFLKDQGQKWSPYIEMFSPGDSLELLPRILPKK